MKTWSRKENGHTINDLTGINHYDKVLNCFITNDETYIDILKIRGHDLLNTDQDKVTYECYSILKWIKTYPFEYEFVGMHFPVDTTEQQLYFEHVLNRTENPQYQYYLSQKLNELKIIDQKMLEKQFYLFLFFDNEKDLKLYREKTIRQLAKASLVEEISRFNKEMVLYKINNKNLSIPKERIRQHVGSESTFYLLTPEQEAENEKAGYDVQLLRDINVAGNISFPTDDRYVKTGTGYEACIYVYQFPETLSSHWMMELFNIDHAITSVHIAPKNMREVKKNINKSLGEQESRISMASRATEIRDARKDYEENLKLYNEIQALGEIILATGVRLYIAAPTYEELDALVATTISELDADNFKACVYLNEQKADWQAVYKPYSKQQLDPLTARKGNPFKSKTLAFGNPFHFSSLMDPSGDYFGLTCSTSGPVLFDPFAKTKRRSYYNAVLWGEMGSGKSTILKKIFKSMVIRGNYIRGFDVSGEWVDLVNEFGGTILALDGSQGRINDMEVIRTSEDEITSYKQHVGKMSTIYRYLKPSATDDEIFEYENLLSNLYIEKGLLQENGMPMNGVITGLPHDQYPTYSDLYEYVTNIIEATTYDGLSDAKVQEVKATIDEYVKIKRTIQNLIKNYGELFDGPTTIENVLDSQILFYDIQGLRKMKDAIFDAMMFKALSLCYDNCIKIGSVMKSKWEQWEGGDKENGVHPWDVVRFMILVDEFHRIINAHKLMAIEQILTFEREARKFFGGIWFASQSVNDSVPDNADSYSVEQLKKVFELCQYKIIMQQDSSNIDKLKKLFHSDIPDAEIEQIPQFETGQCILNIKGDTTLLMNVFITEEEKALFKGGA